MSLNFSIPDAFPASSAITPTQTSHEAEVMTVVMSTKALMPTMLVQKHKDKTITHMVREVLTWFGQPCLRPWM